jgi:hypothetical protein
MSSPELHLPSLVNSGAEGPTRLDRVEVTLIPWDSPYIGPVRDAVRAAGGELVRTSSGGGPGDLLGRLLVVDLS